MYCLLWSPELEFARMPEIRIFAIAQASTIVTGTSIANSVLTSRAVEPMDPKLIEIVVTTTVADDTIASLHIVKLKVAYVLPFHSHIRLHSHPVLKLLFVLLVLLRWHLSRHLCWLLLGLRCWGAYSLMLFKISLLALLLPDSAAGNGWG